MPKELRHLDDITWVTGLRSTDDVLFIGGNVFFPRFKEFVGSVSFVKKAKELDRLMASGRQFDRVFIARENVLTEELVVRAVRLARPGRNPQDSEGLVCFLSDDQSLRTGFIECVEANYPVADVWPAESNVGPLVMTNAKGSPVGMD